MKYLLALVLVLSVSCSTELKYKMSNHKFLSPETKGEFLKGDISISYQREQKVLLGTAYDAVIFNLPGGLSTDSKLSSAGRLSLPLNLGLLERLDFYTLNSKYGLKYQFYGSSEKAREVDYKAAIAMAYGYENQDSESLVYTSSNNSRNYNTDMKVKSYELSLILGKRINESFLWYINFMRDYYNYKGALTSNQFSALNVSGHSTNMGANLGLHFLAAAKQPFTAKTEVGVVNGKLDNRDSRTAGTFGLDLGWSW